MVDEVSQKEEKSPADSNDQPSQRKNSKKLNFKKNQPSQFIQDPPLISEIITP